jgi:hypothetical protein
VRERIVTRSALIVCLVLGAVVGFGLAVGPAHAGDAIAQFEFQESEQTADRGETITVKIWLRSDGGYAGEGVESYSFVVAVPPEVGEPTDAEIGPFLAGDGGEVEGTVTDAGEGAVRVRHERVDATDGVTGADLAATVTIEIREDAPAADATVLIAEPRADLARNDYRLRSFGDDATIVVAGGGERLDPTYEPERGDAGGSDDGTVDVTTANETNRTVSVDDGEDSGSGDDPTPGFGIGLAVTALAVVALVVGTARVAGRRGRD